MMNAAGVWMRVSEGQLRGPAKERSVLTESCATIAGSVLGFARVKR